MSVDMFLQDFENRLKNIADDLQNHNLSQSQLNHTLLMMQQQLNMQKHLIDTNNSVISKDIKSVLKDLVNITEKTLPEIKTIEDIPLAKHPKWFTVEIPFSNSIILEGATNYVNINPEGPFVISQVMPFFEITKGQDSTNPSRGFANHKTGLGANTNPPIGRVIPCTAFPMFVNSLGLTNTNGYGFNVPSIYQLCSTTVVDNGTSSDDWGVLSDIPEFEFQIEIGGSGRFWTNNYLPAAAFYGTQGYPNYLGCLGWVDRMDRLIVHARTMIPLNYDGVVKVVFHGYQMLGHIDIAKALGY